MGNLPPTDENGQFALVAIDHLHLCVGVLPQRCRQTGGVLPGLVSDRALSDRYLLHGGRSSGLKRAACWHPNPSERCIWRATARQILHANGNVVFGARSRFSWREGEARRQLRPC
jgi:hypothetical protein